LGIPRKKMETDAEMMEISAEDAGMILDALGHDESPEDAFVANLHDDPAMKDLHNIYTAKNPDDADMMDTHEPDMLVNLIVGDAPQMNTPSTESMLMETVGTTTDPVTKTVPFDLEGPTFQHNTQTPHLIEEEVPTMDQKRPSHAYFGGDHGAVGPSAAQPGNDASHEQPIEMEAEGTNAAGLDSGDAETILEAIPPSEGPTVKYYEEAPSESRLLLSLRGEDDSEFPGLSSALGDKRSQKILTKELLREVAKVRCKYFKSPEHDSGTKGRAIVPSQMSVKQLEKWLYENPIVLDEEKPYLRKELRILTNEWGITKPESQEDTSEPDAEYKDWEPKAKESKFNALLRSFCQFTITPLVWITKRLRGDKQSS